MPNRGHPFTTLLAVSAMAVAGCAPVPAPSASGRQVDAPQAHRATCANPEVGYTTTYPEGWFVHPADEAKQVGPCQQFGIEAFDFDVMALPGGGGSVWLRPFTGSCLNFELTVDVREVDDVEVGGLPAYRIRSEFMDGLRDYLYVINLNAPTPVVEHPDFDFPLAGDCRQSAGLLLGTREGVPGVFEENVGIVDEMAATLEFDAGE